MKVKTIIENILVYIISPLLAAILILWMFVLVVCKILLFIPNHALYLMFLFHNFCMNKFCSYIEWAKNRVRE